MKVEFTNYRAAKERLNSLVPEAKSRTRTALGRELHRVLKKSQTERPSVPEDSGALVSTGNAQSQRR